MEQQLTPEQIKERDTYFETTFTFALTGKMLEMLIMGLNNLKVASDAHILRNSIIDAIRKQLVDDKKKAEAEAIVDKAKAEAKAIVDEATQSTLVEETKKD